MIRVALILLLFFAVPRPSFAQDAALGNCPCTLKGLVLNAVTGAPIRNALVESNSGSPSSALTDSDGAFHFDNLPAGSASLSVIKPGFLPSTPFLTPSPSFRVAPDAPPAVVKLVPGGVVRGHIADDQGVPLENFSVQLFRRTPGSSEPTRQSFFTIVTNDLGNFRIPDLPAGSYYLVVAPQEVHAYRRATDEVPTGYPRVFYPGVPDFSSANPIKVSAGRESIANFALAAKPFVRLSGKVSGYPPGSSVDLAFGRDLQTDSAQSINLDRRTGAFQTDWIPPGDYLLVAGAEPDSSSSQSAALMAYLPVTAASSVSGLNVVLLPGVNVPVNIEGLTRNEDLAQFVVQVSLKGATNSIQAAEVLPKESAPNLPAADMYFLSIPQGTYHIDVSSTADDPYYVESARSGSTDLLASDLVVDSSTAAHPVEIVVRHGPATLSGSVNLKDAARGAIVCLFPEKSGAKPLFQTAAANGSFRFDALPPGGYRIAAVDSLSGVDFANTASLKKISSAGSTISLSPSQSSNLTLDLVAVEE